MNHHLPQLQPCLRVRYTSGLCTPMSLHGCQPSCLFSHDHSHSCSSPTWSFPLVHFKTLIWNLKILFILLSSILFYNKAQQHTEFQLYQASFFVIEKKKKKKGVNFILNIGKKKEKKSNIPADLSTDHRSCNCYQWNPYQEENKVTVSHALQSWPRYSMLSDTKRLFF